MMPSLSSTAMVFAAGRGTRMRELSLIKPKPLQEVGGRTMLDHALDKLIEAGIERAVVNTHHLAEQIEDHLKSRADIKVVISREDMLLETGGGIAKALPYFEDKPFIALNADLPWIDGPIPSLLRMKQAWDEAKMDALLLVMPTGKARGFDVAKGDYAMEPDGRLWRKGLTPPRPYVMIGAQILKPALFANPPGAVFSNNVIWDLAEANKRLYGIVHEGTCHHVSTPEDLKKANELLASGKGWAI